VALVKSSDETIYYRNDPWNMVLDISTLKVEQRKGVTYYEVKPHSVRRMDGWRRFIWIFGASAAKLWPT